MAIDDIVDTLILVSSEDELMRASIDNRLKELEIQDKQEEEKEILEETEEEYAEEEEE